MTQKSDFKWGEQVEHTLMGQGVVIDVEGEYLIVAYKNGGTGEYDDLWFSNYPDRLSHFTPDAA